MHGQGPEPCNCPWRAPSIECGCESMTTHRCCAYSESRLHPLRCPGAAQSPAERLSANRRATAGPHHRLMTTGGSSARRGIAHVYGWSKPSQPLWAFEPHKVDDLNLRMALSQHVDDKCVP